MNKTKEIIDKLERINNRLQIYLSNYDSHSAISFLNGFYLAINIATELPENFSKVQNKILISRGWQTPSGSYTSQMKEKGLSEDEIVKELFEIEIETWRFLEKNKLR